MRRIADFRVHYDGGAADDFHGSSGLGASESGRPPLSLVADALSAGTSSGFVHCQSCRGSLRAVKLGQIPTIRAYKEGESGTPQSIAARGISAREYSLHHWYSD